MEEGEIGTENVVSPKQDPEIIKEEKHLDDERSSEKEIANNGDAQEVMEVEGGEHAEDDRSSDQEIANNGDQEIMEVEGGKHAGDGADVDSGTVEVPPDEKKESDQILDVTDSAPGEVPLEEKKDSDQLLDATGGNSGADNEPVAENTETGQVDASEEGELGDSGDEGELPDSPANINNEEFKVCDSDKNLKRNDGDSKMEFGMDENRQEEEQLDYGEDELEEKLKSANATSTETPKLVEKPASAEKSDGEVGSESEGEIKSDIEEGADFEEGETRDHPFDLPPEQKKICKFFEIGNCTWGDRCRYLHPGVNDKGNYNMFNDGPKRLIERREGPPDITSSHPPPFWDNRPPVFAPPPAAETAWEKGLRHAKEMKKRAMQRKVQEPDFLQKREVISVNIALNEDRDMEFVNNNPVNKKGFNPLDEIENDEYATPTIEEVRRQMNRDRRRPPPIHRIERDRRLPPPPEHMMPPEVRRRPPSPRQRPERFPPDIRRLSPQHDRGHMPPSGEPGRHDDRRERRDYPDRPSFPNNNSIPREPGLVRGRDDVGPPKEVQNGVPVGSTGEQWSDPWARGRPQTKGRTKQKEDSSSSSGSSSGSSSRSSSRSSASSHSSGSSRSSSRSSGSSRSSSFSSNRDSSVSPSRGSKPKKKQLTVKERNAVATAQKKPSGAASIKPAPAVKPNSAQAAKPLPPAAANRDGTDKKPLTPNQNITAPPKKVGNVQKPKKRASSSSSEFSHSSDSSPSPSRVKGKNKSGSESDSGSSSGSSSSSRTSSSASSSSDSDEEDKPQKRRKVKPQASKNSIPNAASMPQNAGKVVVPSKPGRKDVKMTIIDKPGVPKKRPAGDMSGPPKKSSSRRTELLEQLKAVEDAIARKRAKLS